VERVVLRRVSILIGHFSLEAALAVAEQEGIYQSEVEDAVESLVNKSLILAWPSRRGMFYRLLDTTRSYALEKLVASGEHSSTAALYTSYLNKTLENNRGNPLGLESGLSLPDHTTMAKLSGRVKA
jgi:predicted ATPase